MMKRFYPIISSLVTAMAFYVATLLEQKITLYRMDTLDMMGGMGYESLLILVMGAFIGWNLWMLMRAEKSVILLSVSFIIVIAVLALMYWYLRDGFLYPIILIGAYGFLLISKLFCKNK